MNLDIQWVNCSTEKYKKAETCTVGKWRADVWEEAIVDLSRAATWSIINTETSEIMYGGINRSSVLLALRAGEYIEFEKCKEEAEHQMLKLIDNILSEAVEKEILANES